MHARPAPATARLAWLAMLLLCLGPLLSQWLLPAQAEAGCGEHAASPAPSDSSSHGQQALWAKCGYCTLLFSSPALAGPALLPGTPALFAPPYLVSGGAQRVPASPVFPGSRSRAPPPLS
ncbi:Protein of unknown function [Pseudomonas benzenivorans]|nr:DUF2946 family protein [Pseudomonas benzenivorans]SDH28644.1 Protein of unknown function [Pseudomonas benzenivorans]